MSVPKVAIALAVLVAAGLVAECSGANKAKPVTASTPTAAWKTVTPRMPEPLTLPSLDMGTRTLLEGGPTSASSALGTIKVGVGTFWVLFNCTGDGVATIILGDFARLPVTCSSNSMNQISVKTARKLAVSIEAPASVAWAIRITR